MPARANSAYGVSLRRDVGQLPEEEAEDPREHQRLQHGPERAYGGLLVTDGHVALGEEVDEIGVAEEVRTAGSLQPDAGTISVICRPGWLSSHPACARGR